MSETHQSIGVTLRDARIAKGYTIDDLQQATKIQKRYLIALEDEHFSDLPGDFYVRAFIKQYADTVGLNGQELLDQYNDHLPSTKTQEYVDQVNDANPAHRSAQQVENERIGNLRHRVPIVIGLLIVIMILLGIWLASTSQAQQHQSSQTEKSTVSVSSSGNGRSRLTKSSSNKAKSSSNKDKSSSNKDKSSSNKDKSSSNKAKSSSNKDKSKSDNQKIFNQESTTGVDTIFTMKNVSVRKTVGLSTVRSAWSSVNVNGNSVWQGILRSGGSHRITLANNAKSVTINMGNAPATKVTINDHKLPVIKEKGRSVNDSNSSSMDKQVQNVTIKFK